MTGVRPERIGAYVIVVGPDGTGKSTLARQLTELGRQEFQAVQTMHWRPGILPKLGRVVGLEAPDAARPHDRSPYGLAVSLVRLAYYWVDEVVGYWIKIWPCRRRGGLIVMERGYWDMLVDPQRYRLGCPPWVVRLLGAVVPRPSLTVLLGGDPDVIAARKRELPAAEVARQLECWNGLAPRRSLLLTGALTEEEVFERVADRVRTSTTRGSDIHG